MDLIRKYPGWSAAIAFALGLIIGLPILGWWLWPVQWINATPNELSSEYQQLYIYAVADAYAVTGDVAMVQAAIGSWGGEVATCQLASQTDDAAAVARLDATVRAVNGQGCQIVDITGSTEPSSSTPWAILFLLGLLIAVVIVILYLLSRRQSAPEAAQPDTPIEALPERATAAPTMPPPPLVDESGMVPIAQFRTNYTYGNDLYDDSFSIENSNSEFLGECGVGIAEAIGGNVPKNVTAFEVWLFDKRDIRTITKVVMSDNAYFDEALKAKLAPKGEPVLARESETLVLETASLIINAEITEINYGSIQGLPPQSYFDRFVIELSAWAKNGDYESATDSEGAAEQLDF